MYGLRSLPLKQKEFQHRRGPYTYQDKWINQDHIPQNDTSKPIENEGDIIEYRFEEKAPFKGGGNVTYIK